MRNNPLTVLGLDPGTTIDEARVRYRLLAKKFHPDKASSSSDRFLAIKEAMVAIEGDPSLLNSSSSIRPEESDGNDLWVSASVKIEEVLFSENISITTNPKRKCPQCLGTGSKDHQYHTCLICAGKGRVPGEIMRMATGSNVCPECKGSGVSIPVGKGCLFCKGTSLAPYVVMKSIPCSPALLSGGMHSFVFKGEGSCGAYGGQTGDLHITLDMQGTAGLEYRNGKVMVWAEVTPAMYVTGCDVYVDILGEKVKATMQPMTGRSDVEFRGKKIQVRASLVIPYKLPKDQITQYKILRELEKKQQFTNHMEVSDVGTENPSARTELRSRSSGLKRNKVRPNPIKQVSPGRKSSKRSAPRSK